MNRRLGDMNPATMPGPGDLSGYNDPQFATDGPDDDLEEIPDDWGIEDRYADADDSWMDDI